MTGQHTLVSDSDGTQLSDIDPFTVTTMMTMTKMTRLSCCGSSRRSSGNVLLKRNARLVAQMQDLSYVFQRLFSNLKEQEQNAKTAVDREAEIATSNPLLNLAAALGQTPGGASVASTSGTFAVKRRWDDGKRLSVQHIFLAYLIASFFADLIFKNQAVNTNGKPGGQFVNDLLRTEFHK